MAVVDAGTVHGAAVALDLTASAVTKRLQTLERRLGTELFERRRDGLRPTDAARALDPDARVALAALTRGEAAVAEARGQARRRLRLAASHTVGEHLLPGWLAAARGELDGAHVLVDVVNSPGVLAAVREGAAELGFVEGIDALDGLEALVVAEDELVVVVAAGHAWARRSSVRPEELPAHPYVTREDGSGTRAVAETALSAAGVRLHAALEVASAQAVKRALASGGFSVLSRLVVEAEVAAGSLVALPVRDVALRRALHAVRRPGRAEGAADALWRWLAARAR